MAQEGVAELNPDSCPTPQRITRDKSGAADLDRVWTDETSNRDGLLALTYCWMYKRGELNVSRLSPNKMLELPAGFEPHVRYGSVVGEKIRIRELPVGFTLYKDMAYEIRTQALLESMTLTVRVPSVRSEEEFKKLRLLYLDEDFYIPGVMDWSSYDNQMKVPPSDFKTRTLNGSFDFASVFHHATGIGRFVVASFDQTAYDKTLGVQLGISSLIAPPYVRVGETFNYTITVANSTGYNLTATDTALYSSMDYGVDLVSVTSSQGRCRPSVNSGNIVVCELGSIETRKKAVVTVTVKAKDDSIIERDGESVFTTMSFVRSKEKEVSPEDNLYQSRGTIIRR